MHRWWVLLHVVGAFGFVMAHGVSVYATFQVGRERDPARVKQLLELSASSVGFMWNAIGVLLLGGIVAGFTGGFWGQGWIWAAIVILVAVIVAMYALATRWAARLRTISAAMIEGTEAVGPDQWESILRSRRPHAIAAVGFVGLVALLYLMIFKPTLGLGVDPCEDQRALAGTANVLCASDEQSFDRDVLRLPAGEPTRLEFLNEDDGVPHNVAIYPEASADEALFVGDTIEGPDSVRYEVPSLDAGTYYFRCDIHPVMDGSVEVA